jgi:hypothetical protein
MVSKLSSSKNLYPFYELCDPFRNRALRLIPTSNYDWITTDYAIALSRGETEPNSPIFLQGYMGGQVADFIFSGSVFIRVISKRVYDLLQSNKITGWKIYPVEVFDRKGQPLPGYYGFSIIGKECRRDRTRSQRLTKQIVPQGDPFEYYKGLYFFDEDWDGSDIFLVQNNIMVVTEKVLNLFKKNKVTNVEFIPLVEVEMDLYLE